VIGLGVGEQHAAAYASHPAAELVAVCDLDKERLRRVAAQYPGVLATTDEDELLELPDLDVVSIASYDDCHYRQARRAIERGLHLFVEKPLCLHREEAEGLAALLRSHPEVALSSNLILRESPRFKLLKELVDDGRLGRLFYLEGDYEYGRLHKITQGWRGDRPHYSVVLGGAVHLVDLLLWLSGDSAVEVSAAGNRIASEGSKFRFDDFVVATLTLASGALAKITANYGAVRPHFHGVQLFGTAGTFVNDMPDAVLYSHEGEERISAPYPGVGKGQLLLDFLDALRDGRPPAVSADEVFRTLAVCFAIEESAAARRPVAVRPIATVSP
jgi:predicted dehydrogenase